MTINLRIALFIVGLILFMVNFRYVKKDQMPFKYFLIWMIPTLTIVFLSVFPNCLNLFKSITGFKVLSNMFVGVLFVLLFFICIRLTVIVADLNKKIILLIQKVSSLQKEVDELKKGEKE